MSDTPTTPDPQPGPQQSASAPPPPAPEPAETAIAAPTIAVAPKPRSALAMWAMIAGIVAIVTAIIPGLSFIAGLGTRVDEVVADEPAVVDEQPEPSEAAPEPEPEPEVVEPAPDVVYSGTGDTILQIELPAGPDSIGIATMTHSGRANFAVWSLDANLEQSGLLVNEIGNYSGTVPFNLEFGEQITAFEISADGAWTVTLRDVLSVREAPQGASTTGQGDDVLVYRGDATVADISHTGSSNFAVWSFGDRSDLLVNEIGAYTGQVRWQAGAALIQVSADGAWTIALQ